MVKRSLDTTGGVDKSQKKVRSLIDASIPTVPGIIKPTKTERSHEENQERAYIAASRRADRSIEARVQSARMASSIHKKRTGRGFKVTEEIVLKEEMYEEEEDEFPRHYRALTAHLQTGNADMNNRLNAYVSNHVAMANLAHQQNVDRMFAEQFPNAAQISRRLSMNMHPLTSTGPGPYSPLDYSPSSPTAPPFSKRHSTVSSASTNTMSGMQQNISAPMSQQDSIDENVTTPVLTPGSGSSTATPQSTSTPLFSAAHNFPGTVAPSDPLLSLEHTTATSAFTSELPAETKMLANFDPSEPMTSIYYGDSTDTMPNESLYNFMGHGNSYMTDGLSVKNDNSEYFSAPSGSKAYPSFVDSSRVGTPGGGQGDGWESWVDYD